MKPYRHIEAELSKLSSRCGFDPETESQVRRTVLNLITSVALDAGILEEAQEMSIEDVSKGATP